MLEENMAEKKQLPASTSQAIEKAKPQQPTLVEQVEQELQSITSANFYQVPGRDGNQRMEPDSRALQHYANKFGGIATKLLDSGMDDKKAWAHVQAWPKNDPTNVQEDRVTIVFELEFQSYVWDYVQKGCRRHKNGCPMAKNAEGRAILDNGVPRLDDPVDIMELRRLLNRKMRFAEREAITKVKSRLYKVIMNMEWRDQEEIENEARDVALINDKSPLPTTPAPQAAPRLEPPKAAAPAQPVPSSTATPQAAKSEPVGPPKAHIPTEAEMAERAKNEEARKAAVQSAPLTPTPAGAPKKRSERLAELALRVGCSNPNILAFMARTLKCTDPSGLNVKPKNELDAVITGLEEAVKRFGTYMRSFVVGEPMDDENLKNEINQFFLSVFAAEMNKGGSANG
jgi:hypothetical protein